MSPGFSLILPAHNEGAVIEQTLRSIAANRVDRPIQVIVVANGCTDDTAQRPRHFATQHGRAGILQIEVIERTVGSKTLALNLGDRAARYFPRAFLDADCQLSPNLLQRAIETFQHPQVHLVAPEARYIYAGRNPFLAGYYRLWQAMPYVKNDTTARGFYAIDAELRERFDEFPSLTADDRFIRNLARPHERRIAQGCYTTVRLPATFSDLIAVKTRWTYGNLELARQCPQSIENDGPHHQGAIGCLIGRPDLWPHVPAFLFVYWCSHRRARRRLAQKHSIWERSESSRPESRGGIAPGPLGTRAS